MEAEVKTKITSYLTFKLGEEIFAANVSKVLNILELTEITKVPQAPEYMKGVINLRGEVLPLVDVKVKFGMEPTEFTTNTCILVLDLEHNGEKFHLGTLVDSVQEVLEISDDQLKAPPAIGTRYKSEFIEGVHEYNDEKFIMILNMDLIFSSDEIISLKENAQEE
jgi:purine-binding chemotaxis protein CheW